MELISQNSISRWSSQCQPLSGPPLRRLLQRIGHVTATCCDQRLVLVWGGYHLAVDDDDDDLLSPEGSLLAARVAPTMTYHDPRHLLVHDADAELWWLLTTAVGSCVPPPPLCGATAACLGNSLYIYGGFGEGRHGVSSTLLRLCLSSLQWQIVSATATGVPPLPCDKLASWTYNGRLYVFGGFGPPPPTSQRERYRHVRFCADGSDDSVGRGWLDQLVCYDPDTNHWHWPSACGEGPGPRAAHAAARVGSVVYVYGGRCRERLGDLYCLKLDSPVLEWQALPGDRPSSWHSLAPLGPAALLLYGGISEQACVLSEPRLFCLRRRVWLPFRGVCRHSRAPRTVSSAAVVSPPPLAELPPRMWHTAVAVTSLDECAETLVVGGLRNSVFDRLQQCADGWLTVRFRPRSLCRLCVEAIVVSCTQQYQPRLMSMLASQLPANLVQQLTLNIGMGDY